MSRRMLPIAIAVPLIAVAVSGCGSGQEPFGGPFDGPQPGGDPEVASERSDRLRQDLAASCLDEPSAHDTSQAPTDPIDAQTPGASEVPGFGWLDPGPGTTAAEALETAVEGARSDLDLAVSVGVHDRGSGGTQLVGEQRTYPAASLSKLPVAMTFVHQLREDDQELTEEDHRLLEEALVRSDNDAASQLYTRLGASEPERTAALQETFDLLGTDNGAASDWPGADPTSAADQLRIVDALQDPPPWLDQEDAELLTGLMAVPGADGRQPDESQDFGVGSLALPPDQAVAQDVHVKNGWIDDSYEGTGTWSAGSTGFARVDSADLDLVIQLDGAPSYECAFSALDAMAHVSAQTAGS
ncbi:serine hydrolase [Kocuria palustris]|uniref:serine hydrolase n=1 Tax=Kocuria palustris TaxID=71999 RepID=UPI00119E4D02|nr:serine hydrolase [Kocuria palustris]